jgi:DNA-binding SARP family transcriptional activator
VDVRILGPLLVRQDGHEFTLGAAMQRSVLILLVLRRGEVLPTVP